MPGWIVPGVVAAGCLLGAVILFRVLWSASWPRTPQHYLDLARAQFESGRTEQALATLDVVAPDASGRVRQQANALREEIRRALAELAGARAVAAAQHDLDLLQGLHDRYLDAGAQADVRPAARELVRAADRWLAEHRQACQATAAGRGLVEQVERLRERHYAASALPAADDAADVLFAARARLRFQVREYRAAIALLDDFLATAAGAEADRVRAARAAMLAEGEDWLRGRVALIGRLLDRGDKLRAGEELRALERHAVLPQWQAIVAPVRERLR